MVANNEVFVGFRDALDARKFGFRAQGVPPSTSLNNWFAIVDDGVTPVAVDTGVPVSSICAFAQELEIEADFISIRFFINGILEATIPTPAGIFTDNFRQWNEAIPGGVNDHVDLFVDYICASMGRKCQEKIILL